MMYLYMYTNYKDLGHIIYSLIINQMQFHKKLC